MAPSDRVAGKYDIFLPSGAAGQAEPPAEWEGQALGERADSEVSSLNNLFFITGIDKPVEYTTTRAK